MAMFREFDTGAYPVADLCSRYGGSRETFYVWKRRRESGDDRWYEALSRVPGSCPHATPERVVSRIVAMRRKHPHFGP